jgi:hypothetical protein
MSYAGAVGDHVRVDACGKVIDTRSVFLDGRVTGRSCASPPCVSKQTDNPTTFATFVARYDIATQYGGLSMDDEVKISGGPVGSPFSDELRGVIDEVPRGGVT